MCLIIYSPDGHIPRKHLKRGLESNPDGWGYMYAEAGEIVIRKGMTPKEFWAVWKVDRPAGPVVWHARIGTHGAKGVDN